MSYFDGQPLSIPCLDFGDSFKLAECLSQFELLWINFSVNVLFAEGWSLLGQPHVSTILKNKEKAAFENDI